MKRLFTLLVLLVSCIARAQTGPAPMTSIPEFPVLVPDLPRISQPVGQSKPFSVIGPRGTILGQQNGKYEAWIFPWKLFNGMSMVVKMQDYPVPIDVNDQAAWIDVQPDATTITYSHANFTIKQIMISPKQAGNEYGPIVFYQFEAVRPMTITFSLQPVMQRMWPAQSDGFTSPEWGKTGDHSGFYVLHLNFPNNAAAMGIPDAEPGILAPYQERARSWPLQFVLHFDPRRDKGKLYPLLLTFATTEQTATNAALGQSLRTLNTATQCRQINGTLHCLRRCESTGYVVEELAPNRARPTAASRRRRLCHKDYKAFLREGARNR